MTTSSVDSTPTDARYAELATRLRSIGQRATPQRLLILSTFREPGEHLSADEIVDRIGNSAPVVNRSTVYRTLELFRDLGLIAETDLGGGVREYQLLEQERHHHLVCHDCGAMVDLEDEVLEPVRKEAMRRYGFSAEIDHLALFGRCRECAGKR